MKKNVKVDFEGLVSKIQITQEILQENARLVINRHVTAKAWLTGYYIVEYEQHGSDRAKYGEKLILNLSERLGRKKYGISTLKLYRQFYMTYPVLSSEIESFICSLYTVNTFPILPYLLTDNQNIEKSQSLIAQSDDRKQLLSVAPEILFNKLSFTHFSAILPLKDPLQRTFLDISSNFRARNALPNSCAMRTKD